MTARDRKRLLGCDATLIAKLERVFATVATETHAVMMVTDGARTTGQQLLLYRKGRDASGKIINQKHVVTYADGIYKKSNHQSGRACDCCFVVDGTPSWDEALPWLAFGEAAEREGLIWGGRWHAPKTDKPHVELQKEASV